LGAGRIELRRPVVGAGAAPSIGQQAAAVIAVPDSGGLSLTGNAGGPDVSLLSIDASLTAASLLPDGGRLVLGTAGPPRTILHVEGNEGVHSGGTGGGFSFADRAVGEFVPAPGAGERWVWYAVAGTARLWSGNDKLGVTASGNVGIGTTTPVEKLEVRGNLKLGANGTEFAVGSPDNLRLVAGSVPESGAAAGNGWTAAHGAGAGVYRVNFTSQFAVPPVVTVTPVSPPSSDNVICVRNVSGAGFDVESRDIDPSATDGSSAQDSAFNFIAVGTRA